MSRVISRYEMREYYSEENGSFLFIILFLEYICFELKVQGLDVSCFVE